MAENIFFGPVKLERRDSWAPFRDRVDALVNELGLRELILRAGMAQPLGEAGTTLNALQRRKMGLARALMKNPGALVLDGIAAGESEADRALRALLRAQLAAQPEGGALVFGTDREAAATAADHVIRIDREGRTSEEDGTGEDSRDEPPAVDGACDGGR